MRTAKSNFFALFLLLAAATVFASESATDGASFDEKLKACAACHGQNGDTPLAPEYPLLAGQYESYLANSLRQYRDGQRTNPIMALQMQILNLTEDDIEALASHFSSQSSNLRSLAD
jgi:cytochrome c553